MELIEQDSIEEGRRKSLDSYFASNSETPLIAENDPSVGSTSSGPVRNVRFAISAVHAIPETDESPEQEEEGGGAGVTMSLDKNEALPLEINYVMSQLAGQSVRPTLDALQEAIKDGGYTEVAQLEDGRERQAGGELSAADQVILGLTCTSGTKFGWIKGVFIRCLLNIWGVMLFIRLSWVTGQAGILLGTVVIALSTVVTMVTSLSLSAICTNGVVRAGGAYYMISRSLGADIGGAIGIIFSIANAVGVAMYVVGFCETLYFVLLSNGWVLFEDGYFGQNHIRIFGTITTIILMAVALGGGMKWEARAQLILLAILLVGVANSVIGAFIPPDSISVSRGVTGFSFHTLNENLLPNFRNETFISVFAVYFPSATGILAGANISGDLKDANSAIPKGTILAIITCQITYAVLAWLIGGTVVRDAAGPSILNEYNETSYPGYYQVLNETTQYCVEEGNTCQFGLMNSMRSMEYASGWGPLIVFGVFAATLSSALASLVSAPKIFQAVCVDKLFPYIGYFGKGYGKGQEPVRAYFLAAVIALGCIAIGELNAIAPIISNFFLMGYALINYACFDASISKAPGFRPGFQYYSKWLALAGAVLCVAIMFVMYWWAALATIAVTVFLYLYIKKVSKPDVNWGSSVEANAYIRALGTAQKLVNVKSHVKNFRPQILALTGYPANRPALVDIASAITKDRSLLLLGHIINTENKFPSYSTRQRISDEAYSFLNNRNLKAFYSQIPANSLRTGARALMYCAGLGQMRPNILFLGYLTRWTTTDYSKEDISDYVGTIADAFENNMSVLILKMSKVGMDMHKVIIDDYAHSSKPAESSDVPNGKKSAEAEKGNEKKMKRDMSATNLVLHLEGDDSALLEKIKNANLFSRSNVMGKALSESDSKSNKEIHVYWLYDDGGLTLLVPHLLSETWRRKYQLRVFYLSKDSDAPGKVDETAKRMAVLLGKFRIKVAGMHGLKLTQPKSAEETNLMFSRIKSRLGKYYSSTASENDEKQNDVITENEWESNKEQTLREIGYYNMIRANSSNATLIVVTLPICRRSVSAPMYMTWLDCLTGVFAGNVGNASSNDLPPMILVRGNQQSVLTFYL